MGNLRRIQDTMRTEANREAEKRYRESHREQMRERSRIRYAADPEKAKAATKSWGERHPERVREYGATYTEKNREARVAATAQWRKENPEKWKASNKRWQKAHPEEMKDIRMQNTTKRHRLLANAKQEKYSRHEIFERDEWFCKVEDCRCSDGRQIDPEESFPSKWSASIDHTVPLSQGGDDTRVNVRAAHMACNSARNANKRCDVLESGD
jgi:hypothetical protein